MCGFATCPELGPGPCPGTTPGACAWTSAVTSWERSAEGGLFKVAHATGMGAPKLAGIPPGTGAGAPDTSGTFSGTPLITTLQIAAYRVTFSGLLSNYVTVNLTRRALVLYLNVFLSLALVPLLFSPTRTWPRRSQVPGGSSALTCTSTNAGVYVS